MASPVGICSIAILILLCGALTARADAEAPTGRPGSAASAQDAFAFDLLHRLAAHDGSIGNLFFSPESVRTAIRMMYAGAGGQTAEQMRSVLRLTTTSFPLETAPVETSPASLPTSGPSAFVLSSANAIWYEQGLPLQPAFITSLQSEFGAAPQAVRFDQSPDAARLAVNDWVERETLEKIKDLLPPRSVNNNTRLILVNAVYLKAEWSTPFRAAQTHPGPFSVRAEQTTPVPMMAKAFEALPYSEDAFAQAVRLGYAGDRLAFDLLVPKQFHDATDLAKTMTAADAAKLLHDLNPTHVLLTIPRFTATSDLRLKRVLAEMGMTDAFDAGRADWSGMFAPGTGVALGVDEIYHKAFVNVDEAGTEAAAATGMTAVATAMRASRPPVVVTADRPFLYLIRDLKTDTILFMGVCANPSK